MAAFYWLCLLTFCFCLPVERYILHLGKNLLKLLDLLLNFLKMTGIAFFCWIELKLLGLLLQEELFILIIKVISPGAQVSFFFIERKFLLVKHLVSGLDHLQLIVAKLQNLIFKSLCVDTAL